MCSIIFVRLFPTLAHFSLSHSSLWTKYIVSFTLLFTLELSSLPLNSNSAYVFVCVWIFALSSWNVATINQHFQVHVADADAANANHIQTANVWNKETRSCLKVECQTQNQYHWKRNTSWNHTRIWKLPSIVSLTSEMIKLLCGK